MIYNRPDAQRLRHLRERPDQVSFHFDSDGHGEDILVLYGRAAVDEHQPPLKDWAPYLDKYGPAVDRAFGDVARFSALYPVALRVTITRVRGLYTHP